MARRTFFSFHYERDAWRAGQVRNCNLLPSEDQHGFIDSVDWESLKRQGDEAIERWIEAQLKNTSVTVVLIGTETSTRPWVLHEITKSWNRGNGLLGLWIHNIKDEKSATCLAGANPFDLFKLSNDVVLSSICKTHDWVIEDGRNNLGKWIEEAFTTRTGYQGENKLQEISSAAEITFFSRAASASVGFAPKAPWCSVDVKK